MVISDNGSTDGTEAICRQYVARDPRFQYHRSETNRGVSWNFRRAAAAFFRRVFHVSGA